MNIIRRSENRTVVTNGHKGAVIRTHSGKVDVDVHHGHDIVLRFRSASLKQVKAVINFVKEGK